MDVIALGLVFFATPFLLSYLFTSRVIKKAKEKGIVGTDFNKPGNPKVAELGGLGFVLGFLVFAGLFLLFVYPVFPDKLADIGRLLTVSSAVLGISAFMGMVSDTFNFSRKVNVLVPIPSGIPLLIFITNPLFTRIYFPILGWIQFGWVYALLLLFGATAAPNAVNRVAGIDGVMGMPAVIIFFLSMMALVSGNLPLALLGLAFLGAMLGFLVFNWYPAKAFPGDIGTFSFGSAIFLLAVLGKMEFWATLMFALYFIDIFLLITRYEGEKKEKFVRARKDGRLTSKYGSSLIKWIAKKWHPREKELAVELILTQVIISGVVFGLYLVG